MFRFIDYIGEIHIIVQELKIILIHRQTKLATAMKADIDYRNELIRMHQSLVVHYASPEDQVKLRALNLQAAEKYKTKPIKI